MLDLLLDNLSNKEIGAKLFVSGRTVKFHFSNRSTCRADMTVLWMQRTNSFRYLPRDLGKSIAARVN